jgi:hypothetical protein
MVEISGSRGWGLRLPYEVGHTLRSNTGAVHPGAGHHEAYDDVLPDGGPWSTAGTMVDTCDPMPDGQYPFDCQGGDYYEVDPAPGGYLAGAWNTADSGWLTKPG